MFLSLTKAQVDSFCFGFRIHFEGKIHENSSKLRTKKWYTIGFCIIVTQCAGYIWTNCGKI